MTIDDFTKTMKQWEGGLSKDMHDSASAHFCPTPYKDGNKYHTNKGITYAVWKQYFGAGHDTEFYAMSDQDWFTIFDNLYFKAVKGHEIKSINVACMVADSAWASGVNPASKMLQRACNAIGGKLVVDGSIGNGTLSFVNSADQTKLFDALVQVRADFYKAIAVGHNAIYLKGWINRLSDDAKKFRP